MDVAESRGRQVVAGNLKVSAELQKAIQQSGYLASFN
jgi:hypothetical protein